MKKIVNLSLLLLSGMLAFTACKKSSDSDDNNQPPASSMGAVMFHLHNYLDNNEVDAYNLVYTMDDGRKISLSLGQYYLSEIQLVKADGSVYNVSGRHLLKTQEAETYTVAEVPAGNYTSVRFHVGLDAATRLLAPQHAGADSPVLNRPEMWFGNTAQEAGYIFLNVQGKIDTTADASGTVAQMQPFSLRIGTAGNYKEVRMPDEKFTVVPGQVQYVHLLTDYYKLFSGIKLNDPNNLRVQSANDNVVTAATIVAGNIQASFRYEE